MIICYFFRNELTDTAGKIASDFEDMKDRQEMLMKKLSEIISSSKSQQFNPILSRVCLTYLNFKVIYFL